MSDSPDTPQTHKNASQADQATLLISAAEIANRVEALADAIAHDMGSDIHAVPVLKGSFVFAADLMRALGRRGVTVQLDFIKLASYGRGTVSTGEVLCHGPVPQGNGHTVLLIEDILDTGNCVAAAVRLLKENGASDVKICALLDKPERRVNDIRGDYVGFTIPNRFVIGYGIDHNEKWRELSYIGTLD